ncbi:MAG: M23 family metallopeptidase, partial [Thermoanaerobaculia bacterium]|nr:M23 family metallopeptidase [Thermoanaerobaculia bacterium]
TVVRWPGTELTSCEMAGRRWRPLDGACWYAIDLEKKGEIELVRRSSGGVAARTVRIGKYPYPTQELEVAEKYVAPPAADLERIQRDQQRAGAAFALETERRFALPLGPPLDRLPASGRFGARRIFNGQPKSPHGGADFKAAPGTLVRAVADGRVVVAEDQYYPGRAVFLDHGDGLISMSFHFSEILVKEGDEVRRGDPIGRVGATGRVTGPHLHFALRWHGARVDPAILLDLPTAPVPLEIR